MYQYAEASETASTLMPFSQPAHTADPTASASQAAQVAGVPTRQPRRDRQRPSVPKRCNYSRRPRHLLRSDHSYPSRPPASPSQPRSGTWMYWPCISRPSAPPACPWPWSTPRDRGTSATTDFGPLQAPAG
ncbi:pPE FAMILY PROTEIN [Mycobacterium kansasii]|nr:pPE FAMILY PROTEIN [Mycobacterium kansasii]